MLGWDDDWRRMFEFQAVDVHHWMHLVVVGVGLHGRDLLMHLLLVRVVGMLVLSDVRIGCPAIVAIIVMVYA